MQAKGQVEMETGETPRELLRQLQDKYYSVSRTQDDSTRSEHCHLVQQNTLNEPHHGLKSLSHPSRSGVRSNKPEN